MRGKRARLLLASALVLAMILAVPSAALGTVTITEKTLSTIPQETVGVPILSGSHVAFDGVVRWDTTDIHRTVDIWDITADASVWSHNQAIVELEDFEGNWVAYHSGGMGEKVYVHNFVTDVTWPIAETMDGMFVRPVDIEGDVAYWLQGEGPSKFLERMDLASGESTEVAPLTRALGMTISDGKVFYTRTFMADWDIWVHDIATGEEGQFVAGPGPQSVVDSNDEYLLYDYEGGLYIKPLAGGDAKLISSGFFGRASISDRFVAWAEYNENLDTDLYLYDLASGMEITLADTAAQERDPDIEGGRVAYRTWETGSESASKVVIADFDVTGPSLGKMKAPSHLKTGRAGKFEVQVVNPDASDVGTVVWDWGDGTTTEVAVTGGGSVNTAHPYQSAGTFTGNVTVTDALGLESQREFRVVVK